MFGAPVVGVVGDAAVFVTGDLVAFHDPFEGGLAIDDVVVGFQWDTGEGEVAVINDSGLIDLLVLAGEGHFLDLVGGGGIEGEFASGFA